MNPADLAAAGADPVALARILWPDVTFYRKQREILYSVRDNDDTIVHAGNMLGKDYVASYTALWFFLTRTPCRVITTSADYSQLEAVLWGEIRRWIGTCRYPLDSAKGGPLVVNHLHLRKLAGVGARDPKTGRPARPTLCPLSYCLGRVAAKGEGLLGHHIADVGDGVPRTLFIADEASGIEDVAWNAADTWARRRLAIGNCYETANFFYRAYKEGDLAAPE